MICKTGDNGTTEGTKQLQFVLSSSAERMHLEANLCNTKMFHPPPPFIPHLSLFGIRNHGREYGVRRQNVQKQLALFFRDMAA